MSGSGEATGKYPIIPGYECEESCGCDSGVEESSGKGQAAEFTAALSISLDLEVRFCEFPRLFGDEETGLEDFESGRVKRVDKRFNDLCLSVIVAAMQYEGQGAVTDKNGSRR
jgi:hypothetical protein